MHEVEPKIARPAEMLPDKPRAEVSPALLAFPSISPCFTVKIDAKIILLNLRDL